MDDAATLVVSLQRFFAVCSFLPHSTACTWPTADILFIIDGTLSVDRFQFQKEISFITRTLSSIKISRDDSQLALAQFTPRGRQEFRLGDVKSNEEARRALEQVPFLPCDILSDKSRCYPRASITSLVRMALQVGNKKWLPDVVVVMSAAKYRLPDQLPRETLFSPHSPLHIFYIVVGGSSPNERRFEPSATSIHLSAVDFTALERLVVPLCETVNSFVKVVWAVTMVLLKGKRTFTTSLGYPTKPMSIADLSWWNYLHWNVTKCTHYDDFNTILWTSDCTDRVEASGLSCWLVSGVLAAVLLLCALVLGYAVLVYRRENKLLHRKIGDMEKSLRAQNEYFTAKLHSQMEQQIKASEKHAEDMRRHNEVIQSQQMQLQRQQLSAVPPASIPQPQSIVIPYIQPNPAVSQQPTNSNEMNREEMSPERNDGKMRENELPLRLDKLQEKLVNSKRQNDQRELEPANLPADLHTSSPDHVSHTAQRRPSTVEDSSEGSTDDSDSGYVAREDHISSDHPARHLPPIDLLFLVDSSSSIGISGFEAVKSNIINVLEDIDIAPGRSRVALVQYALQPSVVFGFDKYYTLKSVQKGVERMSYTGGATMLSKALAFSAGLLYREQNMRNVKMRKHKLMPTPRHDRLQVLCLVSDGDSDDNIDQAAAHLHEKLHIKVMAMVTRNFNKDRLLSVTRYEGSIFIMSQKESIGIWLWRQQKMWAENYAAYIDREKSMPLSSKQNRKKRSKMDESESKSPKSV